MDEEVVKVDGIGEMLSTERDRGMENDKVEVGKKERAVDDKDDMVETDDEIIGAGNNRDKDDDAKIGMGEGMAEMMSEMLSDRDMSSSF